MRKTNVYHTFKRDYSYGGILYKGIVTVKTMRSRLRLSFYYGRKEVHVSASPDVGMEELDEFVIKSIPKLVRRIEKRVVPHEAGYIYLLGKKRALEEGETLESVLKGKRKEILALYQSRVREYEKIMRIPSPYKVRATLMKSRYGSNSAQTHTINLSLALFCYTLDCIDSVVVHELAHDVHRNHGKRFYAKVLKYCPDYWALRRRLIRRQYNKELAGDGNDNTPIEGEESD